MGDIVIRGVGEVMGRVVVLGASGFIGKHLSERLLMEGNDVIAVVRNSAKFDVNADKYGDKLAVVQCEMANYRELGDIIQQGIDAVVYLTWQGSSGPERADYAIQISNLHGILAATEFTAAVNCKKFIATGTISEKLLELGSKNITGQNMMYAAAKISANKMASVLCKKYGIDFTWLRLGNIYGEGNTTGNLMSYTVDMLSKAQRPTFSSATVLQDFVYVKDCVRAIAVACRCSLDGDTYYIGSGNPRELKSFLYEVRDLIDPGLEIGIGERADDGTYYEADWFSIDEFAAQTGFEVEYSFNDGIKKTIGLK